MLLELLGILAPIPIWISQILGLHQTWTVAILGPQQIWTMQAEILGPQQICPQLEIGDPQQIWRGSLNLAPVPISLAQPITWCQAWVGVLVTITCQGCFLEAFLMVWARALLLSRWTLHLYAVNVRQIWWFHGFIRVLAKLLFLPITCCKIANCTFAIPFC